MIPGPRWRGPNLGQGFRSIGSLSSCMIGKGIEPGMEAVHLRRIIAIRCEVVELVGIFGKIAELSLSGHVLDVRAIPGSQREKRRRTRLIQNSLCRNNGHGVQHCLAIARGSLTCETSASARSSGSRILRGSGRGSRPETKRAFRRPSQVRLAAQERDPRRATVRGRDDEIGKRCPGAYEQTFDVWHEVATNRCPGHQR